MTPNELISNLNPYTPQPERSGVARLAAYITIDPESCCWVCNYTPKSKYVYTHIGGRVSHGGRQVLGHRLFYAAARGETLADLDARGMVLDHVKARGCKGGHCVNPAHLEEVTLAENTLRGDGDTANRARRTHCPRGHHLVGANLRPDALRRGNRSCLVCKRAQGRMRRIRVEDRTDDLFAALIHEELSSIHGDRDLVAAAALS